MRNIFDSWQVRQENNCFAFMLFFGFQVSAGQFLITVVLLCVIEMASFGWMSAIISARSEMERNPGPTNLTKSTFQIICRVSRVVCFVISLAFVHLQSISGGAFLVTETALKNSVFLLFVFDKDPLLICFKLALITSESANLICTISSVVLIS